MQKAFAYFKIDKIMPVFIALTPESSPISFKEGIVDAIKISVLVSYLVRLTHLHENIILRQKQMITRIFYRKCFEMSRKWKIFAFSHTNQGNLYDLL